MVEATAAVAAVVSTMLEVIRVAGSTTTPGFVFGGLPRFRFNSGWGVAVAVGRGGGGKGMGYNAERLWRRLPCSREGAVRRELDIRRMRSWGSCWMLERILVSSQRTTSGYSIGSNLNAGGWNCSVGGAWRDIVVGKDSCGEEL